jgi:hypothetical protein
MTDTNINTRTDSNTDTAKMNIEPKTSSYRLCLIAAMMITASAGLIVTAQPAAAETCPATRDVYVRGAESHYTVSCSGGHVFVNGRVSDTLPFFGCAEVKVQIQNQFYRTSTCGGTKYFSFSGPGRTAFVWTYTR